jgi:DNA mismatch repair protein MutL
MAAVSHLTVSTRARGEEIGTLLRLEGGRVARHERRGAAQGTVVTVENLFFNTPARLKFLRSQATEARHISDLVTCYAMAYPALRFNLRGDGRTSFQSNGSGELYDVLVDVYGLDVAQRMLEVQQGASTAQSAISVHGYVSDPAVHRSHGRHLTILVNGRWVRDRLLGYAIREAYHTLLPRGRHPIVVLNVELPPDQVDVNVHPAKSEVRFANSGEVFAVVQRAVRQTIVRTASVPRSSSPLAWERGHETRQGPAVWRTPLPGSGFGAAALEVQRTGGTPAVVDLPHRGKLPMLRVLGQVGRAYVIAEGPTGMYLIDQHAAHERVLYERLQAEMARSDISSQRLLEPVVVEAGPRVAAMMEDRLDNLRQLGFEVEPFGAYTYLIRAVPAILGGGDPTKTVLDIMDEAGSRDAMGSWQEEFIVSLACHGAIRSGQTLSVEQMRELVAQLEETSLPRACPHGRPTMLHVSAEQLEREFGRR